MKKVFFLILMTLLSTPIYSFGEEQLCVKTSTDGGRYEVIQSQALRFTFKLDKYTGDVYELIEPYSASGDYRWHKLNWYIDDKEKVKNKERINYQLFMSGISFRYIILTNIYTGESWIMYDGSYNRFFGPITEDIILEEKRESTNNDNQTFNENWMKSEVSEDK